MITTIDTPDGPFTLLAEAGVVLASGWTADPQAVLDRLPAALCPENATPVAPDHSDVSAPVAAVAAYYAGDLSAIDQVPVRQLGTAWQRAGWAQLRRIAPGAPLSYAGFAEALGKPSAVRSAASICARNPAALFVPCHRVLRGDGSLGGFAWRTPVKASLLAREARGHAGS